MACFLLEQSPDSGIAVGEPRIFASRKLAERVAGELRQPLCRRVGYINGHGIMLPESDVGRRNSLAIFGTFRLTTSCNAQRALRNIGRASMSRQWQQAQSAVRHHRHQNRHHR